MAELRFWKKKKHRTVQLGDREIKIQPASFEDAVRAIMLLAPHVARSRQKWPIIRTAIAAGSDQLLFHLVSQLVNSLEGVPGDLTKVIALLTGQDATWIARFATAEQVMAVLAEIDRVNDLGGLAMGVFEFSEILTIGPDNGRGSL